MRPDYVHGWRDIRPGRWGGAGDIIGREVPDMTPAQLEQAISDARRRMEDHYNRGEYTESRKWAMTMRELIAERSPDTVKQMEIAKGLR